MLRTISEAISLVAFIAALSTIAALICGA